MKNMILLVLILILLPGCMHTKSISPEEYVLSDYLKRGEVITVIQDSGMITELRVGVVTDEAVIGGTASPPYDRVEIPVESIAQIRSERLHEEKTMGAVMAGIIFLPPIIALGALNGCLLDC